MKKILVVLLGLVVVVVGAVGIFALTNGQASQNPTSNAANDVKASATNALIDASGIRDTVQDTIESRKKEIAAATGLSVGQVDKVVADLDFDNWQVITLPADAAETSTTSGSSFGLDGTITTYKDPSYVTVNANGQDITFAVPESAQNYLALLVFVQ